MVCGTFKTTDIPEDQVDAVEGIYKAGPPPLNSVSRTRQPNGLWTVAAVYPPCPPNTAHVLSSLPSAAAAIVGLTADDDGLAEPDAFEPIDAAAAPSEAGPSGQFDLITLSKFEQNLTKVAVGEYDMFRFQSENDPRLSARIGQYWNDLGYKFPGVGTAWSAVFVSWCFKQAGAPKSEFKFSPCHAVFVKWAVANTEAQRGLFRAFPIVECAPTIGDIIQSNRNGNKFNFAHAAAHDDYPSHSAIVVDLGHDLNGRFATTIGGNESDSVRRKRVALDGDGHIVQRALNPFICVIQTLK